MLRHAAHALLVSHLRSAGFDLRVRQYVPKVRDFERDERGDVVWDSLKGPERIEARLQLTRERLVAGAEVRRQRRGDRRATRHRCAATRAALRR